MTAERTTGAKVETPTIEVRAGIDVVVYPDGSCSPANITESAWFRRIKELEALLAAATRDAERLDEMERTKCYPFWNGDGWIFIVAKERSSKIDRRGVGPTVRAAIDAALSDAKDAQK